ncbi:response regulator [Arcticibacter tournemirensis]|uniref:Response regulator n=1 Tax=Arcticibacter tournemirensis TaxID=699437 RepID=A0A4Q0MEY2_9SPHI|nr:response regulator [Arcticibacter tournemirensis]RXF71753.1 response regulator [Arcticibacter tournemirensis]
MSKVFIIDDDPIHQRIAQIMIVKHSIYDEYSSYLDAAKAIEYLEHNRDTDDLPDVILLDLNMPGLDGWDFLDKYDKLKPFFQKDIKIYIVSSSVDEKDKVRAESYSMVSGFISKPLTPQILRTTL